MNLKRLALAAIAAFLFAFIYEFVLHGILLQPIYIATADLWRPAAEMGQYFPLIILKQILFATLITTLYALYAKKDCVLEGLKIGAWIGLLLSTIQISAYANLPMPLNLALAWAGGIFLETALTGIIVGLTYKKPQP